MTNATNIVASYALSIQECANAVARVAHEQTVLVQGHMGIGKSALLTILKKMFPDHTPCYVDCTTKDLGDLTLPKIGVLDDGDTGFVRYITNEELGMHLNGPIIMMLDEYGKSNPSVKQALTRLIYERKMGAYTLHPESLVFATTNLGVEGVGDLLVAHQSNRVTIVTMRKPTHEEWIEWGIQNGINPIVLGFVREFPEVFADFTEVGDPKDNPYIFHPKDKSRVSFVTPRSLESFSKIVDKIDMLGHKVVTALAMGTIGVRAALDAEAFIQLGDKLPSREAIIKDPQGTAVPDNVSALCMTVYRALQSMDQEFVQPWMEYFDRIPAEAQDLFVNGVRAAGYAQQPIVMRNKRFIQWCQDNNVLFTADV